MKLLAILFTALLFVPLAACQRETTPQLISVLDVAPREVELGDRLEILGSGFPQGKNAKLAFRGTLFRPGEKPETGAVVEVDAIAQSSTQIELDFTEGLKELFCGAAEKSMHTTFEGDVEVAFAAAAPGAPPVAATVRAVTVDFRPPTARRALLDARMADGERALAFMGITVNKTAPSAGGLVVQTVAAKSRADEAGIAAGDLLTSLDHVRIDSLADAVPAGTKVATFALRRGTSAVEVTKEVKIDGFKPSVPRDLYGAGLLLLIAAAVILLFMAPTAGIITWVERRVSARIQSRVGPNRAGPQGFLVWIADGIKSITKEDIIPKASDRLLFRIAPYFVFLGVSAAFVVMPFGQYLIAADLDIGILYVVSVTSLVTIGLLTGGWASNNKYSLLGGIRSAAQIVSYEVPGAIAIVCIVMMTGSLRIQEIIRAQGGFPWDWFLFKNPVTFCLFFLYFTTALAEGNRAPFDLPEAESELVAGYSTEYSGMRYLFFFFAEWANVFVMCGIAAALFLGGWQLPGVSPGAQEANIGLELLGAALFLLKAWALIFVVIWIRWTLPRVRIDQMMNLCWKWLVPLSFVAFIASAGWVMWGPSRTVQLVMGVSMFVLSSLLVIRFAQRVRYNIKSTHAQVHLNPFI